MLGEFRDALMRLGPEPWGLGSQLRRAVRLRRLSGPIEIVYPDIRRTLVGQSLLTSMGVLAPVFMAAQLARTPPDLRLSVSSGFVELLKGGSPVRDPHVEWLRFRLQIDETVEFLNPSPLDREEAAFRVHLEQGVLTATMK